MVQPKNRSVWARNLIISHFPSLLALQGKYEQAQGFYENSLAACREYGLKPDRNPLFSLSILVLRQNDYPLAWQRFPHLCRSVDGTGDKRDICSFLYGLASLAGEKDQPERVAWLNGAVQAILEAPGFRYPPFRRAEFDRHIRMARDQLGEDTFEWHVADGRRMTLEQVVTSMHWT